MQSIYVRLMIYGFMGIGDLAGSRPRGSGSIPGAKELRTRGGVGGGCLGQDYPDSYSYGSFRKLGVPYFGVLIIRILLLRVPVFGNSHVYFDDFSLIPG